MLPRYWEANQAWQPSGSQQAANRVMIRHYKTISNVIGPEQSCSLSLIIHNLSQGGARRQIGEGGSFRLNSRLKLVGLAYDCFGTE